MDMIEESRKIALEEIKKFNMPNIVNFELAKKKIEKLAEISKKA